MLFVGRPVLLPGMAGTAVLKAVVLEVARTDLNFPETKKAEAAQSNGRQAVWSRLISLPVFSLTCRCRNAGCDAAPICWV